MRRTSELQTALTIVFVGALMVSNIITAKQIQLPFGVVISGGMFIFPVTYVLSDVFSECYGYRWSRVTCYMAFAMNLFAVLVFALVIRTPAPAWFEGGEAFAATLGGTPRVLVGSFLAFLLGDLANDRLFRRMKQRHPDTHEGFGARAILSSVAGELVDSAVFFPIAFGGQMPVSALLGMAALEVALKVGYEVVVLPLTRLVVEGVSKRETMAAERL